MKKWECGLSLKGNGESLNRGHIVFEFASKILSARRCHGSYGSQDGDGIPAISGEEQVRQTAEAIASFVGQ